VLAKEDIWDRHEFTTGSSAHAGNDQ
jgi:hypothetical protein